MTTEAKKDYGLGGVPFLELLADMDTYGRETLNRINPDWKNAPECRALAQGILDRIYQLGNELLRVGEK